MEQLFEPDGLELLEKYKKKFGLKTIKDLHEHLGRPYQTVASWIRRRKIPYDEQIRIAKAINPESSKIDLEDLKQQKKQHIKTNSRLIKSLYSLSQMETFTYKLLICEIIFNLADAWTKHARIDYKLTKLSERMHESWWLQMLLLDAIIANSDGEIASILASERFELGIKKQLCNNELKYTKLTAFIASYLSPYEEMFKRFSKDVIATPELKFFYRNAYLPGRIKEHITYRTIKAQLLDDSSAEMHDIEMEKKYLGEIFKIDGRKHSSAFEIFHEDKDDEDDAPLT